MHLLLTSRDDILFARRRGTGYQDGRRCVPAGHVEAGESARAALRRAAKEELALDIPPELPRFALVLHQCDPVDGEEWIELFCTLPAQGLIPVNAEPGKCSELTWANRFARPPDVVAYVDHAIDRINAGEVYAEFGW